MKIAQTNFQRQLEARLITKQKNESVDMKALFHGKSKENESNQSFLDPKLSLSPSQAPKSSIKPAMFNVMVLTKNKRTNKQTNRTQTIRTQITYFWTIQILIYI